MEVMGDDLNVKEVAEELGRHVDSVRSRVKKLNSGCSGTDKKQFTLAEDEAILERILPSLQNHKLHKLSLLRDSKSLDDLAETLGRPNKGKSLALRWAFTLQPWIMQHYAGTLNMDIRLMLVNYLAQTYQNRDSIDWDAIASKSEFAGHTKAKLKREFATVLLYAKKSLNTEFSWDQLLVSCREYIGHSRRLNSKNVDLRRTQVIQYFENHIKKLKIENFL